MGRGGVGILKDFGILCGGSSVHSSLSFRQKFDRRNLGSQDPQIRPLFLAENDRSVGVLRHRFSSLLRSVADGTVKKGDSLVSWYFDVLCGQLESQD